MSGDGARNRARRAAKTPHQAHHPESAQQKLVQLVSRLRGCLGAITPRQKQALLLRTGLGRHHPYSARQVARILRVSARRENQIEKRAVAGLRNANAHTSCASLSQPGSAIARSLETKSLAIVQAMLQPGPRAAAAPARAHQAPGRNRPRTGQRAVPAPGGVAPGAAPPLRGGVISPPQEGGVDWLLIAAAVALLLLAAAAVLARRRSHLAHGTAAADAGAAIARRPAPRFPRVSLPRPRLPRPSFGWRPRLSALSALLSGVMALPLLARTRTATPLAEEDSNTTLEAPPDAGDAASVFELATGLEDQGNIAGAERAYRRADELGHPEAAFHLGGMYAERGNFEDAESLYRRADELGHADGAFNLGVLREHRGDLSGAASAYRRSDQRGSALAAFNLGVLLRQRGDRAGAEAAFGRADERGNAAAASSLGELLAERGDLRGAEAAFRRADERGDAAAAFNLGGLLAQRGDLAGAEAAYRRADERGHAAGVFNLGVLLEERGDLSGAEAAYRRAEERGHGSVAEMAHTALLELWGRR